VEQPQQRVSRTGSRSFFLQDLAGDFSCTLEPRSRRFDAPVHPGEEPEATRARLALVAATAAVIRSGLGVMGVAPVEEMR